MTGAIYELYGPVDLIAHNILPWQQLHAVQKTLPHSTMCMACKTRAHVQILTVTIVNTARDYSPYCSHSKYLS